MRDHDVDHAREDGRITGSDDPGRPAHQRLHLAGRQPLLRDGTLYLLATGAGAGASASLVSALIEDIVETARKPTHDDLEIEAAEILAMVQKEGQPRESGGGAQ